MKVEEVINTYESFKMLSEKELPFGAALIVAENMERLKVAYDVADRKRNKIVNDALERDENGNPIQLGVNSYKTKKGSNAQEELSCLMKEDAAISELEKIKREDLEKISIEPKALIAIKAYIV